VTRAGAIALVLAACGASPAPTATVAVRSETPECHDERAAVLDAMAASRRDHACTTAGECRVVTGPGHPDPEYAQVVHASDAERLDARAVAHLDRCGAFHHHEAIDAFRVIEAACVEGHCVADETTYHPAPIE
jgi:hypothetical protein